MNGFDPTKHPRGNQTTGNRGQFATRRQTPAEITIGQSGSLEEAHLRRGEALLNLTAHRICTIDQGIETVVIARDPDTYAVTATRYTDASGEHDIDDHLDGRRIREVVSDLLGGDRAIYDVGEHGDAMAAAGATLAPAADAGDTQRWLLPVHWHRDALYRLTEARGDVCGWSAEQIRRDGKDAAEMLLAEAPHIASVTVRRNESDDRFVVTAVETTAGHAPTAQDVAVAQDQLARPLSYDPWCPEEHDLSEAIDDMMCDGGWTIRTDSGAKVTLWAADPD